jgi:hypothetical protein
LSTEQQNEDDMIKQIYWNNAGKYQAYYDALLKLIPDRGPVANITANRRLEHFRKANNYYNKLHNNTLKSHWDDFEILFDGIQPGKHIYRGLFLESLFTQTEDKMDAIIYASAEEQNMIGNIICIFHKPNN